MLFFENKTKIFHQKRKVACFLLFFTYFSQKMAISEISEKICSFRKFTLISEISAEISEISGNATPYSRVGIDRISGSGRIWGIRIRIRYSEVPDTGYFLWCFFPQFWLKITIFCVYFSTFFSENF